MAAISALHKALPLVAAAYGQKMGVKVAIGGNDSDAYTDGRTIVLPNISTDKYPKEVLWGYLAHEASHIRFTDFHVPRDPGVHAALTNIIEDARIEREMVKAYPGVAADLDAIWKYLKDAGYIQDVSPDTAPAGIIQMYCLYFLRCQQLGQAILKDSLDTAEEALEAVFPKGVCIRLRGILRAVPSLRNTYQAAHMARQILEMLEDEAEKEQQQPPESDKQGDDEEQQNSDETSQSGDSGDSRSSGEDEEPDDEDGTEDEADSSVDGDDGDDAKATGNADDDAEGDEGADSAKESSDADDADETDQGETEQGDTASNTDDANTAAAIHSVLNADGTDVMSDPIGELKGDMQEESKEDDQPCNPISIPREDPRALACDTPGLAEQMADHVKATSAKLQQRLVGLVEATQRQPARPARRGRRVDARRLARTTTGDMRVFKGRQDVKAPNASVHVLVDMSGSMIISQDDLDQFHAKHGHSPQLHDLHMMTGDVDSRDKMGFSMPFQVARNATLALAKALGRIKGVNMGVTAFSTDVTPVLRHGESVNSQTLKKFSIAPRGRTALDEALLYSGTELSKTKEDRKVIIVLSDGEPDRGSETKYVIDQLSGAVEFVGIGILNSAIADYIDNSTVVYDLGDLERTLMDVARASILPA